MEPTSRPKTPRFPCPDCGRVIYGKRGLAEHRHAKHGAPDPVSPERRAENAAEKARLAALPVTPIDTEPNWSVACEVCAAKPTVGKIGLCGPCTWGEVCAAGGNW